MADEILAEALARVEHKLDLLLKHLKVSGLQMHFPGQSCPLCGHIIEYQVDLMKGVVVRRCKCSTGKVAPTIPLVPVQPGVTNGNSTTPQQPSDSYPAGEDTKEGRRR